MSYFAKKTETASLFGVGFWLTLCSAVVMTICGDWNLRFRVAYLVPVCSLGIDVQRLQSNR